MTANCYMTGGYGAANIHTLQPDTNIPSQRRNT
jgi:hypothetical protein